MVEVDHGEGELTRPPLILVVENDPQVARLLLALCHAAGARARSAATKREALALLNVERPALVTLDIELQDGDGLDIARAMQSDPALCIVPVIAISSLLAAHAAGRAKETGCIEYIEKPFDSTRLVTKIRAVLASSGQPGHA